jgi:hypothetical protein
MRREAGCCCKNAENASLTPQSSYLSHVVVNADLFKNVAFPTPTADTTTMPPLPTMEHPATSDAHLQFCKKLFA